MSRPAAARSHGPYFLAFVLLASCGGGEGGPAPEPDADAGPPPSPWRYVMIRGEAASAASASLSGIGIAKGGGEAPPEAFEVCRPAGADAATCEDIVPGGACSAGGSAVTVDVSKAVLVARLPESAALGGGEVVELHLCAGEDQGLEVYAGASADPDGESWVACDRGDHPTGGVLEAIVPDLPDEVPE